MDRNDFDQAVERLKAVNAVIQELDPVLRDQAVTLLKPYIIGAGATQDEEPDEGDAAENGGAAPKKRAPRRSGGAATLDLDPMVEKYASDRDHENAHLALAVFYARYGKGPLNLNRDLKPIGEELGVDLPDRLDRTFSRLKYEGSPVLRKGADGYKVMPAGERFLKDKFEVTKGRGTPPES